VGATRPGYGAGGVGGPASGLGVLPGAGIGRAGVGVGRAGVGTVGVYAGGYYGAGAYYGAGSYGTYYASSEALAVQAEGVNAAADRYPAYSDGPLTEQENAWHPTNLMAASIYTKPGYGALATGLKLAAQPILYDYGANVIVQADAVYINGDLAGTPQEYADQASQIAAAGGAAQPPEDSKWLPLGVFAIVEGVATNSDDVFQLVVNAQGLIRGNYHSLKTNEMVAISGSVDRKSQRTAWTIGDDQLPVYEAGIGNLTKDATPILVHLAEGQTHQLTLIRLAEPQQ
jgi:hypothetical protein